MAVVRGRGECYAVQCQVERAEWANDGRTLGMRDLNERWAGRSWLVVCWGSWLYGVTEVDADQMPITLKTGLGESRSSAKKAARAANQSLTKTVCCE